MQSNLTEVLRFTKVLTIYQSKNNNNLKKFLATNDVLKNEKYIVFFKMSSNNVNLYRVEICIDLLFLITTEHSLLIAVTCMRASPSLQGQQ